MHRFLSLLSLAAPLALADTRTPGEDAPRTFSAGIVSGELRPGSTCDGVGAPLVLGTDVEQVGSTLVQPFTTGCGCPTGPVFTLLFEPDTSPLRVRLCAGPGTDACEMACRGELVWDLSGPLSASGTATILPVR